MNLDKDARYVFQLVSAISGARSETFCAKPIEFAEKLTLMPDEPESEPYVLILACIDAKDDDVAAFVPRFPMMRVSTFFNYCVE